MAQIDTPSALVLFSGGQDSTTCLAWALERFHHVETIGFSYGQRHAVELTVREPIRQALKRTFPEWTNRLGLDHVISLDNLFVQAESSLLGNSAFGTRADGLPSTFVPGRNIIFITIAGILAKQLGIKVLVTGTCETDFSGYPDCRDDTIKALQVTLNLGLDSRLAIETPLMWINKARTWGLAAALGGAPLLDIILEETHTCYVGDRKQRHPWGYGCATCDACTLRARGWTTYANDHVQSAGPL